MCVSVITALVAVIVFLCFYVHSLLPVAVAVTASYALSLGTALFLLSAPGPAEFKCGWLTVIVILPVAGAVLYLLSYVSRTQRTERSPVMQRAGCSSYEYFTDGAIYLDRLIALVSSAKRKVYLEYYIIAKGRIWELMLAALKSALARGVEVKIIYDGLGSALRAPRRDFKDLKRAGAQIRVFNKLLPLPVSRLNFRDHRKIGLIDGDAVFLGGVNIADEYANITSPHGHWKDGGAVFYGRIAAVYECIFNSTFYGKNADCPPTMPQSSDKLELLPVIDEPERRGSVCEDLLAGAILGAKEKAYIFTPYLCMADKLYDALVYSARKGVDVKILVPFVPDKKLTYSITKAYCSRLIAEGVQVFAYKPGFMHFKGVICDDNFALLGSYNLDFRSLYLNYECGVVGGERLARDMERDFSECLALSRPLEMKAPSPGLKLWRVVLRLFAPLA